MINLTTNLLLKYNVDIMNKNEKYKNKIEEEEDENEANQKQLRINETFSI